MTSSADKASPYLNAPLLIAEALLAGRLAGASHAVIARSDNPYIAGSNEHDAWRRGFVLGACEAGERAERDTSNMDATRRVEAEDFRGISAES